MSRLLGAVAGALVAGAGISALLIAGERKSGKPSELMDMERAGARRLGLPDPAAGALPEASEQAVVQGGHLMLSALAGGTYAAAVDRKAGVLSSGIGFGLAFYVTMHWLLGPLLGVKQPEWRSGKGVIGMHALNHVLFGIATAAGARAAGR